ncbi:hypothetical protein ACFQ0K_08400 [Nocardioides caeni]|uniref:Histidine kinase/HSP90-like ATPase domain-containing protein n=1 Tax=Nocardioides caeni TaxID=574700 RepID=A0A4S8N5I2_9ACTN|nr:hypothetical protein [Nocardioides caeni]THV10139.1 hypothetical protein E9934_15155 [Nocardioides caeni]
MVDWRRTGRRFLGDLFGDDSLAGPTTITATASMRRALLRGMALWQVVMVLAILTEAVGPVVRAALVAGHLGLAGVALLAAVGRVPGWLVVLLAYAAFLVDWVVVNDPDHPLLLAACWLANVAAILPSFVMRGRAALLTPVAIAVVVPVAMVLSWPDSGSTLPPAVAATGLAIMAASRLALPVLLDFTRSADAEHSLVEAEQRAVDVRRAASRRAAEDARILHDTVINTLAALAVGGAAVADGQAVRARCARDVATVEALTMDDELPQHGHGIHGGLEVDGIRVERRGLAGDELARQEALLPEAVLEALSGAVTELVRNAAKHSGAAAVVVDVRPHGDGGGGMVVAVADDGVGFDGTMPRGRGLAESVLGRLEGTGLTMSLVTAPGQGTTATLTWGGPSVGPAAETTELSEPPVSAASLMAATEGLQRRASGLFALALVFVGIWLAVTNHRGAPTEEYPMVVVVAVVCAIAWWSGDGGRLRRLAVATLLTLGACVAFVLSAASVDFGRDDVVFWQAICPAGPLLLMLGDPRWRAAAGPAIALLGLTVVGLAVGLAPSSGLAAVSTLVAGAACIGLVGGWAGFQALLRTIGAQVGADQAAMARLRGEVEQRDAASRARRRWTAAGLEESIELLRQVADGRADPADQEVRSSCAEEETYLRQLTQLNPDLIRMGDWFARSLAEARSRHTRLAIRSGSDDADDALAPSLGGLLLASVTAAPAGAQLTTTLFPAPDTLRFTLVGPHPELSSVAEAWAPPSAVELTVQSLGAQDLVEVVAHRGSASATRRQGDHR